MLNAAQIESRDMDNAQFYIGILADRWTTPGGHLIVRTKDTKVMRLEEGAQVTTTCHPTDMNFLVPKRRERATQDCNYFSPGDKLIIKLMRESRSGKMAVCEVGAA